MGGFLIIIVATILALWAALLPGRESDKTSVFTASQPGVQAVAANMIEFHRAAVDFVTLGPNTNPTSGEWTFSRSDLSKVLCSGTYLADANHDGGGDCTSGAETQFRLPSYLTDLHDWQVFYEPDGQNLLVTYSSGTNLAGYTPEQVNSALADYNLAGQGWYWGVVSGNAPYTLSNGTDTQNTPTGMPNADGALLILSIIP